MSKEKYRKDVVKQKENTSRQSKDSLFSIVDEKSVEVSGYMVGHGAPQTDGSMPEHVIPTGVVEFDESVELPVLSSPTHHHNSKPYTISPSKHRHDNEYVHLPSITQKHTSYEYLCPQPRSHHTESLYYTPRIPQRYHSLHHHHHTHEETYDPRWWYMPINSVHAPRSHRSGHHHQHSHHHHHRHHYKPPKWYELSSRQ